MHPTRGRANCVTSAHSGPPIVGIDPAALPRVIQAITLKASPDACEQLMNALDVRDEHGVCWLTSAADDAQALRAALDSLFGSGLEPLHKLRMMIWVLRHISGEPHHRDALRMAVLQALNQTQDGRYHAYMDLLLPQLTYFSRRSLSPGTRWSRQALAADEIVELRSALISLDGHAGPGAFTDLLQRDCERRTLLHQVLANGQTAGLGLDIVHLLLGRHEVEPACIPLLGRLLGAKSRDGCTPLWSADFSDKDVRRCVLAALVLIIDAHTLSVATRCSLLLRFSSPPPRPRRQAWDQVVWWIAQAFEHCETATRRDTLVLRTKVQEEFWCRARQQDRTAMHENVRTVVAGPGVGGPARRLVAPPCRPLIDFVSRPDDAGRPLLWHAFQKNTMDAVVKFVVDLMAKDEASIGSADKFRVLVALLSPGPDHWPANPAAAVQAVIFDALSDRIATPEAALFADELSDLAMLMLPHQGADRTVFAQSLEAAEPEDARRIVRKLLDPCNVHVPRYLHRLDRQGQTLIHLAVKHERGDVLDLLFTALARHPLPRSHKVRVLQKLLFTPNGEGFAVWREAFRCGKGGMADRVEALLRNSPILDDSQTACWLRKMGVPSGQP